MHKLKYLIASVEERANRRYKEFLEKNISISYEEVLKSLKERDFIDSTRKESPLVKAKDAIELDTTNLNLQEVVDFISSKIDV